MENNATDSGGRVTRSLRKRLTSVDSDNSSRPGTPITSKLSAISEISASPSRLTRMTRRNSTSGVAAPVKTPSKRGVSGSAILENLEATTPKKTHNRRRSVSINENDELSQKGLKILTALDEETVQSDRKSTRLTRSQSKSPLLSNSSNASPNVVTTAKTPFAIVDNFEINTARSSISANENYEFSQKILQSPTAFDEEIVQTEEKPDRVTHSPSKSALIRKSERKFCIAPTPVKTPTKVRVCTSPPSTRALRIRASNDENAGGYQKGLQKTTRSGRSQSKSPLLNSSLNTYSNKVTTVKSPVKHDLSNSAIGNNLEPITSRNRNPTNANGESSQKDLQKPTRVTRSQSKSPLLNSSLNTHTNTVSTVKTPVKHGVTDLDIVHNLEKTKSTKTRTPRSSVSTNDNDEFSQKFYQSPTAFDEETVQSSKKPNRITRSKSKSPPLSQSLNTSFIKSFTVKNLTHVDNSSTIVENLKGITHDEILENSSNISSCQKPNPIESNINEKWSENIKADKPKKRKPGPKSKTRGDEEFDEDFSDIEITVFGCEIEDTKTKPSNISPIDLMDSVPALTEREENEFKEKGKDLESYNQLNFAEEEILNRYELQVEKNDNYAVQTHVTSSKLEILKGTTEQKIDQENGEEEQGMPINGKNNIIDDQNTSKTKNDLKCDEITVKENEFNVESVGISDYNDLSPVNLKDSTDLNARHNFKQIRSTEDDDSSKNERISLAICLDKSSNSEDIADTKAAPVLTLRNSQTIEIVQSSTPSDMEVNQKKSVEGKATPLHEEANERGKPEISRNILADKVNNGHSPNQNKDELKWINPSVKVITSNISKLDVVNIESNITANNASDNSKNDLQQIKKKFTKIIYFSSDDESDGDEESYDEAEEESMYAQKYDFHDDEAMEVIDYESGDSLESEERKEIEENEIPIDGQSIDNQTTDDDQDDCAHEEDSEDDNSFIVSDNEKLEFVESDDDEDRNRNINNKPSYKRIQPLADSSSTSDVDMEEDIKFSKDDNIIDDAGTLCNLNKHEKVDENIGQTEPINDSIINENYLFTKSRDSETLDSTKLSDSALRLHLSNRNESEEEKNASETNISSKNILRKLNQSERFNKSIRNLNPETDVSPNESGGTSDMNEEKINYENNFVEEHRSSPLSEESANNMSYGKIKRTEISLGDISVKYESDSSKENDYKSMHLQDRKQERQRSFTIDVTVKSGESEADKKLNKFVSTYSSSTELNEHEREDFKYQENSTNVLLQLGNPLIRTRRQSLALPTNPDMEICGIDRKANRKSLGIFSNIDFKPSQSFIDSIQIQKSERNRVVPKRKRLSRSFCGAPETHDKSFIDVDVCHLHKRSKLIDENSIDECPDSTENINSSKLFTKFSSTPHEKINKKYSSNSEHILSRCDEIIEAANRAKLELKTRYRKNKTKTSKKQLRKKHILTTSEETKPPDDTLSRLSKEIKRKVILTDKTKTAISHAVIAADAILGKKGKKVHQSKNEQETLKSKQLSSDVIEAIGKFIPARKQSKREIIDKQPKTKDVHTTYTTSAGNFIELPQSPKKGSTYIQLATGKVSVEPVTPKKRSVKTFDGTKFRESSVTPHALGFKVSKISPSRKNVGPSSVTIIGKRKRYNESFKDCTTSKPQWTKSGIFTEEDISRKSKKLHKERKEHIVNCNFKEMLIRRPEIKRSTKREILLLNDRRRDMIKK